MSTTLSLIEQQTFYSQCHLVYLLQSFLSFLFFMFWYKLHLVVCWIVLFFYLPLLMCWRMEGGLFTLASATVAIVSTSDRLFKIINNFRWNRYSMKTYTFATKQMPQCTNERVSSLTICVSVCVCLKTAWVVVNFVLSENFWVVLLTKDRCWLHVVKRMSGHFIRIAFKKYSYTKSKI